MAAMFPALKKKRKKDTVIILMGTMPTTMQLRCRNVAAGQYLLPQLYFWRKKVK